jgi:hypothetical protein
MADQVFIGTVTSSNATAAGTNRSRGTITLSVQQTLKGDQAPGTLDLPIADWDDYSPYYPASEGASEVYSHQLLIALRHDAVNRNKITAVDLGSPSLAVMSADLITLKTSSDVIRAAEDEIHRLPRDNRQIDYFEWSAPTFNVRGDRFYGYRIAVPVDETAGATRPQVPER